VIAPADFDPVPVEPDLKQGLAQALVLGLVAATLAATLRDRTDRVFRPRRSRKGPATTRARPDPLPAP
jgi:uncharacterized protein involved in exopolysaccharide biosynthesis